MSTITILHVSDVHFGYRDPVREQGRIVEALIEAAHDHVVGKGRNRPDICVFSGDLAFSGSNEQLKTGEVWLSKLIKPWKCGLFVVPGNHDIQRPPKDSREMADIKAYLRGAARSQKEYDKLRETSDTIGNPQLLTHFFGWHQELQKRLRVISDWKDQKFACYFNNTINGMPTHLIGLNTAIFSCDDDDVGNLVADIRSLNELFQKARSKSELIVVVSHHPIGLSRGKKERWFVKWNDEHLQTLLLQSRGAHLYLHGHLHESSGTTMSLRTGQHLAFFGAGAAYQGPKYPQKFAFYDVDFVKGEIKPWAYSYDNDSSDWVEAPKESRSVKAVLPLAPSLSNKDISSIASARVREITILKQLTTLKEEYDLLQTAYKNIVQGSLRVATEIYSEKRPRHYFEKINSLTFIDKNGDGYVRTIITVVAGREPVLFWRCTIWVEDDASEAPFLEQIKFDVCDLSDSGSSIAFAPVVNQARRKQICIFFLPYIRPGEMRTIQVNWMWPGYINPSPESKKTDFLWDYETGNAKRALSLDLVVGFHPDFGEVHCVNKGKSAPQATLERTKNDNGGITWNYKSTEAFLGTGAYILRFSYE